MVKAIVMDQTGGPENMEWRDIEVGSPGAGEALVRHTVVGLNYIDTYMREGYYPQLKVPNAILGMEAAGVVEAVGEGVSDVAAGDRVTYVNGPGTYCEKRVLEARHLIKIPDGISDETAAAMMLQGMTAEYLLFRTHKVQAGDTILVQAAAGGVGLILCQWAKHLGATVIGTVSTEEKAELARANGCDHPILYTKENFAERVMEITSGKGVPVAYDAVGKDTFQGTFDSLSMRGHFVSYGQSSGGADPIAPGYLGAKSASLTRPSLFHYTSTREELVEVASNLIGVVQKGIVNIEIGQRYELKDAAQAHRDLHARKTVGSTVFTV